MRSKRRLNKKGKILIGAFIILIVTLITITFLKKNFIEHELIETKNYTLKVDYPQIDNKELNEKIIKYMQKQKEQFLMSIKNQDLINNEKYDFQATYSKDEMDKITGIHITIYSYIGGSHYVRDYKSYYYDNKTQEEITIRKILKDDKSLNKLSGLSYYFITEYSNENQLNFNEDFIKSGISPKLENFSHFSLTGKGLELLFPPYQVASYNNGEIKITIPYKELKEVLKQEYIKVKDNEDSKIIIAESRNLELFKGKKLIAFTFDDGPSLGPTNKLLDNLDKYNARVTFFTLGSRVKEYQDTLIRAYKMGNQIGSHTYNHLNLTKLDDYNALLEIKKTNDTIKGVLGVEPNLIRPPYGNINSVIKEASNMYTILWNIDTEDWKYRDANRVADEIVKNAHDGAIVLMHDIYTTSVDGAIMAMERLEKKDMPLLQ